MKVAIVGASGAVGQELLRWYSLRLDAQEITAGFTFHNYADNWYLELSEDWASFLTVVNQENALAFYLWDETYENAQKVMTVTKGKSAESESDPAKHFQLTMEHGVVFSVVLEDTAADFNITEEFVKDSFHLISR